MPFDCRFLPCALAFALALACEAAPSGEDTDSDDPQTTGVPEGPCVPGQSIACGCGGGEMGAAVCRDDGSGYGSCTCDGDPSASAGPGSSASEDSTSNAESGPADGSDGSSGDSGPPEEVSFDRDIKPILLVSCGGMVEACHARAAYAAAVDFGCRGWFSFEDAPLGSQIYAGPTAGEPTGCPDMPLYDRLLELNSWQCQPDGRPIVAPGDPANSYMMMKIDGIDLCADGEVPSSAMPPPGEPFGLPESSRAMIEAWILAGAPNN
jgi:hypothetical protein